MSALNSSVVSAATTDLWSQTIPMGNGPWEKRILQCINISPGPAIL